MDIFIKKSEVKTTNVFQMKWLYVYMHDWLIENNYAGTGDVNFPELQILERRTQNHGNETWIWWRPTKVIEGNKFWRRVINIDFHGVGMRQVEIMYKGKKIKADKGKFELLCQAKLEVDVGGQWRKSWMGPFFELFWKRIFRKEINMYRREVQGDLKTIMDIGRTFHQLGPFAMEKVPWVPARGYEERDIVAQ